MIDPYAFIRIVTVSLGLTWTVLGLVRAIRFAGNLHRRLAVLDLDERWWRRQLALACLRATVLDPTNLALLCLLVGLWTLRDLGG